MLLVVAMCRWSVGKAKRVVVVAAVVAMSTGCGRKATPEDCALIVDRYVEIELKTLKITDPVVVEKRKTEMRTDLRDDLKSCPGKRITDSMLTCVRQAETNDQLDKCTRW
jgi:hypothetical protein